MALAWGGLAGDDFHFAAGDDEGGGAGGRAETSLLQQWPREASLNAQDRSFKVSSKYLLADLEDEIHSGPGWNED
jgi:hypothetical protein